MIEVVGKSATVLLGDGTKHNVLGTNLASKNILKPLTINELKWEWCFHCQHSTTMCPSCETNACSGGCGLHKLPYGYTPCDYIEFWDKTKEAEELGQAPKLPTEDEIEQSLGRIKDYITKYNSTDYGLSGFRESDHYELERMAKKISFQIPTYKEICDELGVEGTFDCKTTQQFVDDDRREYHIPDIEKYDPNERISWHEFLRRWRRIE